MGKEENKLAIELTKAFYRAIKMKVTPALMRQGIGQFKCLLNVYTYEELMKVIIYIAEGNVPHVYSPGYLSYATNKLLTDIKMKELKEKEAFKQTEALDIKIDNQRKTQQSTFFEKFM